jgi:hypothetical protein
LGCCFIHFNSTIYTAEFASSERNLDGANYEAATQALALASGLVAAAVAHPPPRLYMAS